jgi:hypothetical protein
MTRRRHVQLLAGIASGAVVACAPASAKPGDQAGQALARPATVQVLVRFTQASAEGKALANLTTRLRQTAPKLTVNRLVSTPEEIAQWNIDQGGMVTRGAAAAERIWQDHLRAEPRFGVFNEAAPYARSYPAIPGWTEASTGPDGIGQALLDAVTGKVAARTALEEAARRATTVIAQQST